MLHDDEIVEMNPWWTDPAWTARDPELRRLASQPTRLPTPQIARIDLRDVGTYVIRGPRQVGKSTDLKLLATQALADGRKPTDVVYLALDTREDQSSEQVTRSVRRAFELSRSAPDGLLLLDEVTYVKRWANAVKALFEGGITDRATLVCTGSSATDLALAESEGLPGRRGTGDDILVLPQDFGAFARAVDPSLPEPPGMTIGALLSDDGKDLMMQTRLHLPRLQQAFERYLVFGGLPAAVAEAVEGAPRPSEATKRVLTDALMRDLRKKGGTVPAIEALLERVLRSLSSRVSWQHMASEVDVPLGGRGPTPSRTDRRTLQDYIEFMAAGYFALVLYFWKTDLGTSDLSKDKKIYFGDPLLHTVTIDRIGSTPDMHALVENAVGIHLYRRYEPSARQPETFVAPDCLHVWGTRSGGEIDFVCGPRDGIDAVEVADWVKVNRQKATAPMRALPDRLSLVATRTELEFGSGVNLVPAAMLAWAVSSPAR
ncbi:MAG TPA: ATP-binding protein [Acidimicrobiales bacterium]|nr:ATP-binding protein [Acidimicrobiales bacterium]